MIWDSGMREFPPRLTHGDAKSTFTTNNRFAVVSPAQLFWSPDCLSAVLWPLLAGNFFSRITASERPRGVCSLRDRARAA